MAATALLLGLVLLAIFGMQLGTVAQKMNSETGLYILPAVIWAAFYFFLNDFLAHLSNRYQLYFGFEFSEVRFTIDNDNNNTPIPLRTKLLQLYPLTIALVLVGFVLVLMNR